MATAALLRERARYALKSARDTEYDDLSFGAAFNKAKREGRRDFPWRGETYTTKTAEEQGREIAAKAAAGSGRGAFAGRTAADRDTASGRAEIPTGPSKAPASTGEGGMSDTTRNVLNTLGALGAGAGLGARALMKRAAAQKAAAEGAWRNKPPAGADPAKWKEIVQQIDEAYPAGKAPGYAKGGKVKTYAKGGSVKGSGCERRGLRKCKVY